MFTLTRFLSANMLAKNCHTPPLSPCGIRDETRYRNKHTEKEGKKYKQLVTYVRRFTYQRPARTSCVPVQEVREHNGECRKQLAHRLQHKDHLTSVRLGGEIQRDGSRDEATDHV